jgi:hypothetical protein
MLVKTALFLLNAAFAIAILDFRCLYIHQILSHVGHTSREKSATSHKLFLGGNDHFPENLHISLKISISFRANYILLTSPIKWINFGKG